MTLNGKHIVLGITGSIAAYKSCQLIRLFIKSGAEVQVVITPAGKEFITPVTLSALTRKPVVSDFFAQKDGSWNSHVDMGLWADAMVIAPATASSIAKMANGVADNMLITTYLSMKAPVFVAPAMDLDMLLHPSTQHNIQTLRSFGNTIIEPTTGELASKLVGKGRMEEPQNIFNIVARHLSTGQQLAGKKILITAGPTYEKIDPVRFVGNYSSGKMGYAIAYECAQRGASVELVSGPTHLEIAHPNIRVTKIESAQQMFDASTKIFTSSDAAILSAAVADFTPMQQSDSKIKREKGQQTLTLEPTKDIAAALGACKTHKQKIVGFALETDNEINNAKHKLSKKNLDFIVLNSLRDQGTGFNFDTNKITILHRDGSAQSFPLKSKGEVAKDIIDNLQTLWQDQQ